MPHPRTPKRGGISGFRPPRPDAAHVRAPGHYLLLLLLLCILLCILLVLSRRNSASIRRGARREFELGLPRRGHVDAS